MQKVFEFRQLSGEGSRLSPVAKLNNFLEENPGYHIENLTVTQSGIILAIFSVDEEAKEKSGNDWSGKIKYRYHDFDLECKITLHNYQCEEVAEKRFADLYEFIDERLRDRSSAANEFKNMLELVDITKLKMCK